MEIRLCFEVLVSLMYSVISVLRRITLKILFAVAILYFKPIMSIALQDQREVQDPEISKGFEKGFEPTLLERKE